MVDTRVVQTTMAEVLGRSITEPATLSLLDAPLTIMSKPQGAKTEYLAIVNYPLSQAGMYQFLRSASNDKFDPGIYDVFYDWGMPDRAAKESKYNSDADLQKLHLALGVSWAVFGMHRKRFMKAIEGTGVTGAPKEIKSDYLTWSQLQPAVEKLVKDNEDEPQILIERVTLDLSQSELLSMLRESKPHGRLTHRERQMNDKSLRRRLLFRLKSSPTYSKTFYETTVGQRFAKAIIEAYFQRHEIPLNDTENVEVFRKKDSNEDRGNPLSSKVTRRYRTIGPNSHTVHVEYDVAYINGKIVLKRVETEKYNLVPAIHWSTNVTDRQFICGTVTDDDLRKESVTKQLPELLPTKSRIDSLLGLLTVAYFSPSVRAGWPEEMGLPKGSYKQIIGPGQIPVLAHMRRRELETSSPVLALLEQAVAR